MQRRQWIQNIHYKDVGGEDDEVHRQADAKEVAEAVTARAIDEHVGRRAYRGSKAAADTYHQSHKEGERIVAQFLCGFEHDWEEHSAGSSIGDELRDEGANQAYGCHQHNRVGATDVENAVSEPLGNACLLDGKPMLVRMSDLAGKKVELRILPLRKDAPIYLQKEQKEILDNSKAALLQLNSIDILKIETSTKYRETKTFLYLLFIIYRHNEC